MSQSQQTKQLQSLPNQPTSLDSSQINQLAQTVLEYREREAIDNALAGIVKQLTELVQLWALSQEIKNQNMELLVQNQKKLNQYLKQLNQSQAN